eukprot:TRINITY_DN21597_c0_g1_i1.p1 TRINITY_DN21597_c0_g1~~TRINITY_DN21597_c0_g1_i1.p1  ORF type:complete len:562 (-),score=65.78 TRINITY_DN21597_c0_g1_i1:92-1777(-)
MSGSTVMRDAVLGAWRWCDGAVALQRVAEADDWTLVVTAAVLLVSFFVARRLWYGVCTWCWAPNLDRHFMVDDASKLHEWQVVGRPWESVTLDDIPTLVAEMRASFESGRSRPLWKRKEQLHAMHRMMTENEDKIREALAEDLGRPAAEAMLQDVLFPLKEVEHMIAHLDEYARPEPQPFNLIAWPSANYVYKEPLGLCLVIGTWNYPFALCLEPVLGAIAAGNTCILKPCNVSSHSAKLISTLVTNYLDPGIVSVVGATVPGDRTTTHKLLEHKFDHVFFTGSPSVGRVIAEAAARHLTPCTLELGGKNPVLVSADANLRLAAKRTVWGRNLNAGQLCISPDYVLVEESVADAFCVHARRFVTELYGEDPRTAGTIGRVVGDRQMRRLVGVLESHGGAVVCGGDYDEKTRYIAPTVVRVSLASPAMEEETFGPILLVVSVPSVDAAIQCVRSRPKPLALYVFASSQATVERILYNTSAGGVTVNGTLMHMGHLELPFGGVGNSGMGAYHGKESFTTFSHRKPVVKKSIWPDRGLLSDPFVLYPPWSDFKIAALRVFFKLS